MGQKENHERSHMGNIRLYNKKLKSLAFTLLAVLIFTVTAKAESNLLRNGDFNNSLDVRPNYWLGPHYYRGQ